MTNVESETAKGYKVRGKVEYHKLTYTQLAS